MEIGGERKKEALGQIQRQMRSLFLTLNLQNHADFRKDKKLAPTIGCGAGGGILF